jgi:hypothetical protein
LLLNGKSGWIGGIAATGRGLLPSWRAGNSARAVMENVLLAYLYALLGGGGYDTDEVTWG